MYTKILLKSVCLSVGVSKLQVTILAQSSREISLTVRIIWQYFLSRVRISVRPSNFFICEKHPKPWGNRVASMDASRTGKKWGVHFITLGRHRRIEPEWRRRCVCMCARARACMCCMRACVCAWCVFAMYDNNISPRLIMIIITIIILYFIQIRHTDNFPSTGTRLVDLSSVIIFADTSLYSMVTINILSNICYFYIW